MKRQKIGFGHNQIYVDEIKSVYPLSSGKYEITLKDGRWYYFDPDVRGNEGIKRVLDKFINLHI